MVKPTLWGGLNLLSRVVNQSPSLNISKRNGEVKQMLRISHYRANCIVVGAKKHLMV